MLHSVVSISTKKDVGQMNGMAVNVEECEDEFLVLRRIKNAPTTRSQRRLFVRRTRDSWTEAEPARILEGQGMPRRTTRTMQACKEFFVLCQLLLQSKGFSVQLVLSLVVGAPL